MGSEHTLQTRKQPKPSTLQSRLGLGLVAAALLFLTSCYRIDTNLTVENDGSGQLGYVLAFNYEAFATLDESGASDRDEFCAEATADQTDIPENATAEEYDEDGYCGIRVTVDIPASDDFGEALREAADDGSDASNDLQDFEITKTADDQWSFYLSLEGSELDGLETAPDDGSEEAEQFRIIQETLEIRYNIELPGEAGDHNADSASSSDGKTRFEWEIDPYASLEPLTAETVPASGGTDEQAESTTSTTAPSTPPTEADRAETDTTAAPEPDSTDDTEPAPDEAIGDLPFDDETTPAVTSTGPGTVILVLGMLAILAVLAGIVALVIKWPSKTVAAAPGVGPHPNPSMAPPSNPFGGPPQSGPPPNGPPQSGPAPGGPQWGGPPPGESGWGGPPPPVN